MLLLDYTLHRKKEASLLRHTNPILRPAVGISAVVVPQNIHKEPGPWAKRQRWPSDQTRRWLWSTAPAPASRSCASRRSAASRPKPPLAASARKRRKAPAPRRSRLDPQGSLYQSAVASKHQGPPSLGGSAMVPAASSPMRPFSLELSNLFC